MAIQILGLRDYFDTRTKSEKKKEVFFEKNWRSSSVPDLFRNLQTHLEPIPLEERYNLYYTVGDCHEIRGRQVARQDIIPFDIDKINIPDAEKVARCAVKALGLEWDKTGVVYSGNGVQLLVQSPLVLTADEEFPKLRVFYKGCCGLINMALLDEGLEGEADVAVWSPARLMRLPGTENRKKNKETRQAALWQANIEPQDFDIRTASGIKEIAPKDQIASIVLSKMPTPDTQAILEECAFLHWIKEDPVAPDEPQLYAAFSVMTRFPEGPGLTQDIFRPRYGKRNHAGSAEDVQFKLEQAQEASGPRTCASIDALWGKCSTCRHFNQIKSPIQIQGPNYIESENFGFHDKKVDANGNTRPGRPVVEDLRRYFHRLNGYITMEDSQIVYIWDKLLWREIPVSQLEAFAYKMFKPKVNGATRSEFCGVIQCTNLKAVDWFSDSVSRKINFQNGIYDIDSGELQPTSGNFGFRYVLPYAYDPNASCPTFDRFLNDITCNRPGLAQVLLEYIGYALSGDACWEHKALMLLGQGRNGKSTLMHVIQGLAGKGTYSSVTLTEMKNETARQQLDGKLFNMAEETSPTALLDSSIFKNLVSGGEILVKKLYHQPYTIQNRAKLIFSCNELPYSKDKSDALYRRMIIVPFDKKFTDDIKDPYIAQKMQQELPGIFNRVAKAYRDLVKRGKFASDTAITQQLQIYEESNDVILNFMQDELRIDMYNEKCEGTPCKDIYSTYKFYAESNGDKAMGSAQFFQLLKTRIADYDKRFSRKVVNGLRERRLNGIYLGKSEAF